MSKGLLAMIAALVVLGVGSFAATRLAVRGLCNGVRAPMAFAVLQDYLELSSQQRKALEEADARYASVRPALRDAVIEARDGLLNVLEDPKSDREEAVRAAKRFCRAQEALQLNTVEYMVELRGHLNASQKKKLAGLMGRGMCALTGGPCQGGMGLGPGRGMGGGQGAGFCGGQGWRGGRR